MIGLVPDFADRLRRARREERFAGMAVPGYFRKPFGPGWALVGDAGYNKDFQCGGYLPGGVLLRGTRPAHLRGRRPLIGARTPAGRRATARASAGRAYSVDAGWGRATAPVASGHT